MQCQSCKEDVPAKFAHAISINSCPLCGNDIVPVFIKNILNELEVVLNKAKDHMDQMEDWLFTNYSLRKIKDNEVVIDKNEMPVAVRDEERPQGKGQTKGASVRRARDGNEEDGVSLSPKKAIDIIRGRSSSGLADPSEFVGTDEDGTVVNLADSDEVPLNKSEVDQMQNLFGNGIQSDPKEDAKHSAHLNKLKNLQRG